MAWDPKNYDPNWDRTGPAPPGYHYIPGSRMVEPNDPGLPPGWAPIPPAPGGPPDIHLDPREWTGFPGVPPAPNLPPPQPPPGPPPPWQREAGPLRPGEPGYVPPNWQKTTYDPNARDFFGNPGAATNLPLSDRTTTGWAVPKGWREFLASKGLWSDSPYEPDRIGYNAFRQQLAQPNAIQQNFWGAHPDIAYSKVVDAFGGVDTNFGRYAQQHFKQLFDRYNNASTANPNLQWTDYLNQNADSLRPQYDASSRTERGLSSTSPFAVNGGRWLG